MKSNYSFKMKYTVNNKALTTDSKRFPSAAVGGPGSAHDAQMLKESSFFDNVLNDEALLDKNIALGDFGDTPLVTIGDSAFPRFSWLIKCYDGNTRDIRQKYFNNGFAVRGWCLRMLKASGAYYIKNGMPPQ